MKEIFKKSLNSDFLSVILFLIFPIVMFSCQSTKSDEIFAFEDGLYSYSFERVTESVQTESLYIESGMDYALRQSKLSSGSAIKMEGMMFDLPDFYEKKQSLLIERSGKVWSKSNSTISGYATKDGRIAWSGTFINHGQTVRISEYGYLNQEYNHTLAPSTLNGKYSVNLGKMYGDFEFTLRDGIANSDFGSFIVNQDGEFRTHLSIKMIQKIDGNVQLNTLTENTSYGKINTDGTFTYKMFSNQQMHEESNNNIFTFSGKKISNRIESNSTDESNSIIKIKNQSEKDDPKWFNPKVSIKRGKISICAKQFAKDKKTARAIALTTALASLAAERAIQIRTEPLQINDFLRSEISKTLYELIEIEGAKNGDYKVTNEYFNEATNTFYLRIVES